MSQRTLHHVVCYVCYLGSRSEDEEVDPWQDSFLLCASSGNTGYALLYALVAQGFATDGSSEGVSPYAHTHNTHTHTHMYHSSATFT